MTTSLIDSLTTIVTPELSAHLASSLGEPVQNVTAGLNAGMASMLTAVAGKTGDPAAMQSVFSTVTNAANDGRILDDPAAFLGGAESSPLTSLGGQFMSGIFGDRAPALHDALATSTGLRVSSVASLMQFAAPLVLAVLSRRVRASGLSAASLTRLFSDERDSFHRALPPGVADVIGGQERVARSYPEYEVPLSETGRVERVEPAEPIFTPEPEPRRTFAWPAVVGLVVLGVFWAIHSSNHPHLHVAVIAPPATGTAAGDVAPTMGTGKLTLTNGIVLDVPSASAEGRLVAFLTDSTQRVNDTTWFELDRTGFETNSTTLRYDSNAQIKNVAEILKAYPSASVKIGGYTDSTGNESANVRLSRSRAESVRRAIIADGISGSRVSAEGYGSRHPVAPNDSEDTRARNRRIALRVTAK